MSRYSFSTAQGRGPANNGRQRRVTAFARPIRYASALDGAIDSFVDFNPVAVNNTVLDGWRATVGERHYALGIPGVNAPGNDNLLGLDGVMGFGARQGNNWLLWRIDAFIHIHRPTRTVMILDDTPNYDRANLTRTPIQIDVQGTLVTIGVTARWNSVFTTPTGGAVDIEWEITDDHIKEKIHINQAAREWVEANRGMDWVRGDVPGNANPVPTAVASDMYFGARIETDFSEIPRRLRNGVLLEGGALDDYDNDLPVTLEDDLQRFLFTMPISTMEVDVNPRGRNRDPNRDQFEQPLHVRHWTQGAQSFMAAGVNFVDLNGLVAGPLVLDPQVTGAFTQDGYWDGTTWNENSIYINEATGGANDVAGLQADVSGEGITDGANCSAADVGGTTTYDGGATDANFNVADDPSATNLSSSNNHTTFTQQGSSETFQIPTSGAWETNDTGNLAAALQGLFQNANWPGDENINIWIPGVGTGTNFAGLTNNSLNVDFFWEDPNPDTDQVGFQFYQDGAALPGISEDTPTFVGSAVTDTNSTTGPTGITITPHASTAEDDVMVAFITRDQDNGAFDTITGWTLVTQQG